jgi:hypothetical protein
LQGGPRKEIFFCNVAPGRPGSGSPTKFRPTAGRGQPGTGGGGALGPKGPIRGVVWAGEGAGEGRRRRPGTVAAAACCAGGVIGLWGRRHTGELGHVQGKVGRGLFGPAPAGTGASPWLPSMAPAAARPWAWREVRAVPLLWAARRPASDHKGPRRRPWERVPASGGANSRGGRQGTDRWSVGVPGRTARGARRGQTLRRPWDVRGFGERASEGARGLGRRGGVRCAGARATSRRS